MDKMNALGFKYNLGEVLTHVAMVRPVVMRRPQRLLIVARVAKEGPEGLSLLYYVRAVSDAEYGTTSGFGRDTFAVREMELCPIPASQRD